MYGNFREKKEFKLYTYIIIKYKNFKIISSHILNFL